MVFPKARLAASAALFLAWIGFLAYLVAHTRDPVILSRPQLAVSSVVVLAQIQEKDGRPAPTLTVKQVISNPAKEDTQLAGAQLTVQGLTDCGSRHGWRGPGEYIVPLTKHGSGPGYEVTPIPLSPGYVSEYVTIELVRVGPEKEKVAELVGTLLGHADTKAELAPGILRRNVPGHQAVELKKKLEAAKAAVRITEGEARIYRATTDALEQLKKE